jgi:hypothetical protein
MSYKADFRPVELLGPDGVWRAAAAGTDAYNAPDTVAARDENCPAPAVEMP